MSVSKGSVSMPSGGLRVTMTEVARAAGVSQSTVSMVLRGRAVEYRIPRKTADKVWAEARRLGYRIRGRRPRSAASAFAPGRRGARGLPGTGTISVVFVEYRGLSGDILYSPAYLGLCRAATGHELCQFGGIGWSRFEEWARSDALSGSSGIVLFTHRDPAAKDLAPIEDLGIPWILMNRDPDGIRAPRVLFDAYNMAYGLIEDLLRGGHRRIAALGTDRMAPSQVGQRAGYRDALASAGCYDPDIEMLDTGEWDDARARDGVRSLLLRRPDVTALYAYFDWRAEGIYQGARDAGRRIPDDLSVVATGGQPAAQRVSPPLTTMRYPMLEMGEAAFRLLERIWRGEPVPLRTVIPGELMTGASTAAARPVA